MSVGNLDHWLDEVSVSEVDDYHNEVNDGELTRLLGWFTVITPNGGVIAYHMTEKAALRHRLDIINHKLNPYPKEVNDGMG